MTFNDLGPAKQTELRDQLIRHEGLRLRPYEDTVGKLTIGVGRNLDDRGISTYEATILLDEDLAECWIQCRDSFPWFKDLDWARQRVLIDMCFNLGITGLTGFKNTLCCIEEKRYADAAVLMLQSKWAKQVGQRAVTLSNMMRVGGQPERASSIDVGSDMPGGDAA